ncbi:MAG: sensor domain-containing diguanylate cyclase [Deltaproteobacteria bacterium]|nr:sensor domain-containing diguanylate cyclase [Deltaproteobacteria bacterium]
MSENNDSNQKHTVIDAKKAIFEKIFNENQELREKSYELSRTLANFEQLAQEREEQHKRFELLEENILQSSGNLINVLDNLSRIMAREFEIPYVSITLLESRQEEFDDGITVLPDQEPDTPYPSLNFISENDYLELFPYHRPLVTRQLEAFLEKFFELGEDDPAIASAAFIPLLCRGQAIGILNMASPDPEKFIPGTATDAVESLGRKLAIVIENSILTARLQKLLRTDQLTGLFNRRTLDEILPIEFARAQRYDQPLTLVMIDLDDFKTINDTYGHPAGDLVLQETGRLIRENLRRHDIGLRYGGDEFTLILPSTDYQQGLKVIDKLTRIAAETEIALDPESGIRISLSAGLATCPDERISDVEELKKAADDNLYKIKSQKKSG